MIKCRAVVTSPFCHSGFVLFSSFVIRASSFLRHDRAERQSGQRIGGTRSRLFFRDGPALQSKELRVPSTTAGDGSSRRASAGGRTASDSRSEQELFTGPERSELQRLAEWALTTRDGSLSDLSVEPDPKVWAQVCSEAHVCTQKTCSQDPRCFYQQARKRLLAADVIVLNHTLLFILLGSPNMQEERESGFLVPNDFIIFDEAHTVEQIASRQIGIGVSQDGLRSTIQRLYNARTRKGLFTVMRDAVGVRLAAELIDDVDKFFSAVESQSDFRKGREFRVRDVDFVPDTITGRLTALQARIAEVVKRADDEILKAELHEFARRIRDARDGIAIFLEQSAPEHVYWVERTGKTAQFLSLNAAPIDLAPVLRRMIFRENSCSS